MIDAISHASAASVVESQPRPATSDGEFGFDDLLDIFNPLQHLPIIGTAYRAITGDEIEAPARLAGGALYGGLAGFLSTLGTFAVEGIMGDSIDGLLLSVFDSGDAARAQRAYTSAQTLTD